MAKGRSKIISKKAAGGVTAGGGGAGGGAGSGSSGGGGASLALVDKEERRLLELGWEPHCDPTHNAQHLLYPRTGAKHGAAGAAALPPWEGMAPKKLHAFLAEANAKGLLTLSPEEILAELARVGCPTCRTQLEEAYALLSGEARAKPVLLCEGVKLAAAAEGAGAVSDASGGKAGGGHKRALSLASSSSSSLAPASSSSSSFSGGVGLAVAGAGGVTAAHLGMLREAVRRAAVGAPSEPKLVAMLPGAEEDDAGTAAAAAAADGNGGAEDGDGKDAGLAEAAKKEEKEGSGSGTALVETRGSLLSQREGAQALQQLLTDAAETEQRICELGAAIRNLLPAEESSLVARGSSSMASHFGSGVHRGHGGSSPSLHKLIASADTQLQNYLRIVGRVVMGLWGVAACLPMVPAADRGALLAVVEDLHERYEGLLESLLDATLRARREMLGTLPVSAHQIIVMLNYPVPQRACEVAARHFLGKRRAVGDFHAGLRRHAEAPGSRRLLDRHYHLAAHRVRLFEGRLWQALEQRQDQILGMRVVVCGDSVPKSNRSEVLQDEQQMENALKKCLGEWDEALSRAAKEVRAQGRELLSPRAFPLTLHMAEAVRQREVEQEAELEAQDSAYKLKASFVQDGLQALTQRTKNLQGELERQQKRREKRQQELGTAAAAARVMRPDGSLGSLMLMADGSDAGGGPEEEEEEARLGAALHASQQEQLEQCLRFRVFAVRNYLGRLRLIQRQHAFVRLAVERRGLLAKHLCGDRGDALLKLKALLARLLVEKAAGACGAWVAEMVERELVEGEDRELAKRSRRKEKERALQQQQAALQQAAAGGGKSKAVVAAAESLSPSPTGEEDGVPAGGAGPGPREEVLSLPPSPPSPAQEQAVMVSGNARVEVKQEEPGAEQPPPAVTWGVAAAEEGVEEEEEEGGWTTVSTKEQERRRAQARKEQQRQRRERQESEARAAARSPAVVEALAPVAVAVAAAEQAKQRREQEQEEHERRRCEAEAPAAVGRRRGWGAEIGGEETERRRIPQPPRPKMALEDEEEEGAPVVAIASTGIVMPSDAEEEEEQETSPPLPPPPPPSSPMGKVWAQAAGASGAKAAAAAAAATAADVDLDLATEGAGRQSPAVQDAAAVMGNGVAALHLEGEEEEEDSDVEIHFGDFGPAPSSSPSAAEAAGAMPSCPVKPPPPTGKGEEGGAAAPPPFAHQQQMMQQAAHTSLVPRGVDVDSRGGNTQPASDEDERPPPPPPAMGGPPVLLRPAQQAPPVLPPPPPQQQQMPYVGPYPPGPNGNGLMHPPPYGVYAPPPFAPAMDPATARGGGAGGAYPMGPMGVPVPPVPHPDAAGLVPMPMPPPHHPGYYHPMMQQQPPPSPAQGGRMGLEQQPQMPPPPHMAQQGGYYPMMQQPGGGPGAGYGMMYGPPHPHHPSHHMGGGDGGRGRGGRGRGGGGGPYHYPNGGGGRGGGGERGLPGGAWRAGPPPHMMGGGPPPPPLQQQPPYPYPPQPPQPCLPPHDPQQQPQPQPQPQPHVQPAQAPAQEGGRGASPITDEEDCGEEDEVEGGGGPSAAPAVSSEAAAAAAAAAAMAAAASASTGPNGGSGGANGGRRLVSGLSSGVGQNTCYLNVVVQSLWGLRAFRDRILAPSPPYSSPPPEPSAAPGTQGQDGSSSASVSSRQLEQALRAVMAGLSRLEEGRSSPTNSSSLNANGLPPSAPGTPPRSPTGGGGVSVDGLREALSARAGRRFRAGHMDDAVEAFEEILECLEKGGGEGQRAVAEAFTLHLREVMHCPGCGRPSPTPAREYDTNVFYVPVRSLMEAASWQAHGGGNGHGHGGGGGGGGRKGLAAAVPDFGARLQGAGSGDLYGCGHALEGCPVARRGEKHAGHRYLVRRPPRVFSLALVWDTLRGDSREIQAILGLIEPVLRLGHFRLPSSTAEAATAAPDGGGEYVGLLQGFFAFHPQKHHYVCFLARHPAAGATGRWVCLDDSEMHLLGPSHAEALRQCAEQQHQPTLLFYEVAQQPPTTPQPPAGPGPRRT